MNRELKKRILTEYFKTPMNSDKLARKMNLKKEVVEEALADVRSFQAVQRKKPHYHTIVARKRDPDGINDCVQVDLLDYTGKDRALKKENGGLRYALVVVDVYSRYCWSVPVKYKTVQHVWPPLMRLLRKHKWKNMTADRESAWTSKRARGWLKVNNVQLWLAPEREGQY